MRLASRIVVTIEKFKGKTGTIMDFIDGAENILIGFDDGTNGKFQKKDIIEINDVESEDFCERMKVYVSDFGKVGEIVSKQIDGGVVKYKLKWIDGSTSFIILNNEKDYIVI